MEIKTSKNNLYQLLGIAFFAQALLPLIGGLVFQSLEIKGDIGITMSNIANNVPTVSITILLWIAAVVGVIILGIALYNMVSHLNKTMAMIAFSMYLLEAVLAAVGQIFVFGLVKLSQQYLASGDAGLINIGSVLLSCRHFAGEIAMIPFGVGAMIFYFLLMKSGTIPKWLAIWGLVTAPLIMVGIPLTTFGITVPIFVLAPYVPFEFFTGIYILIRYRKKSINKRIMTAA